MSTVRRQRTRSDGIRSEAPTGSSSASARSGSAPPGRAPAGRRCCAAAQARQQRHVQGVPDRRGVRQPAALAGDPHGVAQATEFVDETVRQRVRRRSRPGRGRSRGSRRTCGAVPRRPWRRSRCRSRRSRPRCARVRRRRTRAATRTSGRARRAPPLPVPAPMRSSSSLTTTLPPNTPIEPVSVAGSATMTSAGQAMYSRRMRRLCPSRRPPACRHRAPGTPRATSSRTQPPNRRAIDVQHEGAGVVVGQHRAQCRGDRVAADLAAHQPRRERPETIAPCARTRAT